MVGADAAGDGDCDAVTRRGIHRSDRDPYNHECNMQTRHGHVGRSGSQHILRVLRWRPTTAAPVSTRPWIFQRSGSPRLSALCRLASLWAHRGAGGRPSVSWLWQQQPAAASPLELSRSQSVLHVPLGGSHTSRAHLCRRQRIRDHHGGDWMCRLVTVASSDALWGVLLKRSNHRNMVPPPFNTCFNNHHYWELCLPPTRILFNLLGKQQHRLCDSPFVNKVKTFYLFLLWVLLVWYHLFKTQIGQHQLHNWNQYEVLGLYSYGTFQKLYRTLKICKAF